MRAKGQSVQSIGSIGSSIDFSTMSGFLQNMDNQHSTSGYLQKKSPSAFKGYQKRFFMITQNGEYLVYFANDNLKSKPKGGLKISEITDLVDQEKLKFQIDYNGRQFKLKAMDLDSKMFWLTNLRKYMEQAAIQEQGQQGKEEKSEGFMKQVKAQKDWKRLDSNIMKDIQISKEIEHQSTNIVNVEIQNQSILEQLGLKEYFQQIDIEVLKKRLNMGFINKRSKGNIKYFQKRWFILISSKSLLEEQDDEYILNESELPSWMCVDTLYYYKVTKDDDENYQIEKETKKDGRVMCMSMRECVSIECKNMTKSKEEGFSFRINMGDKIYHLMCETEIERQKWIQCLQKSIVTSKEMKNTANIKITKNLDNIIRMYEQGQTQQEKKSLMQERIKTDIEKIEDQFKIDGQVMMDNFDDYTLCLNELSDDLLNTLNALSVKNNSHVQEIIQIYLDQMHEHICDSLRQYWDESHEKLGNFEFLFLAQWISDYQNKLDKFIIDERLEKGINVLLNTFYRRSIEKSQSMVENIVEQDIKQEPFQNDDDQLQTNGPLDLFKLINEIFDMTQNMCKLKQIGVVLCKYSHQMLKTYQHEMQDIFETNDIGLLHYVAICNNVNTFNKQLKKLVSILQSSYELSETELEKNLQLESINKGFTKMSNLAIFNVFKFITRDINNTFSKKDFLKLDLEQAICQSLDGKKEVILQLHIRFQNKLWKDFIRSIVIKHFACCINSCSSKNYNNQDDFVRKLENDRNFIEEYFQETIYEKAMEQLLKPYEDFMEFIQETSIYRFQSHCKNLRSQFGPNFNKSSIQKIMNLIDMSKSEKADILEACLETIKIYEKQNKDQINQNAEENEKHNLFKMDESDEEIDDTELEQKMKKKDQAKKRQTMMLQISQEDEEDQDVNLDQDIIDHNDYEKEEKKVFNGEGYMEKKKDGKQKWDKRYFRILNQVLYWYNSDRSREIQNKIKLETVENIQLIEKPNRFNLMVRTQGDKLKVYKLKTESQELRVQWIDAIDRSISGAMDNLIENIQVTTIEGKKPIFIDYDAIRLKNKQEEIRKEKLRQIEERKNQKQDQKNQNKDNNNDNKPEQKNKDQIDKKVSFNNEPKDENRKKSQTLDYDFNEEFSAQDNQRRNQKSPKLKDKILDFLGLNGCCVSVTQTLD